MSRTSPRGTEFPDLRSAIVATRGTGRTPSWPARSRGCGACRCRPTPTDSLHPATRAYLEQLQPEQIYVIGGTAAIATPVREALEPLAVGVDGRAYCTLADGRIINACRVGGATRVLTALGIGELARFLLGQHPTSRSPTRTPRTASRSTSSGPTGTRTSSPPPRRRRRAVAPCSSRSRATAAPPSARTPASGSATASELDNLILAGDHDLISDDAAQMIRNELLEPTEPGAAEGLYCRPPEGP